MSLIIDSANIEGLLQNVSWRQGFSTQALAASALTLVSTSNHVQCFTGSTAGQIVELPSALTLGVGQRFDIINNSTTQTLSVKDGSGVVILVVTSKSISKFSLTDASTVAGIWVVASTLSGTASGVVNYKVTSSASFSPGTADVLITTMSVVPVAGTYAVWFSCSAQIVTNNVTTNIHVYNGATKITDSIRTVTNSVSTFNTILSTQTTSIYNGTNTCEAHTDRSGGTMTITGRSLILIRLGD